MKKMITISSAEISDNCLKLKINEPINGFIPSGQMLVDSDHFSFIYLMEDQDDYTYLVLPESIWPVLMEAIKIEIPAFLVSGVQQIELISFQDELNYLISNIKGNGNYGDEMVKKVENTFLV